MTFKVGSCPYRFGLKNQSCIKEACLPYLSIDRTAQKQGYYAYCYALKIILQDDEQYEQESQQDKE